MLDTSKGKRARMGKAHSQDINKVAPKSPQRRVLSLLTVFEHSSRRSDETQFDSGHPSVPSLEQGPVNRPPLPRVPSLHCTSLLPCSCPSHRFCSATIRPSSFPAHALDQINFTHFSHAAHRTPLAGPDLATCIHIHCCVPLLAVIVNSAALKMKIAAQDNPVANNNERRCTQNNNVHTTALARQDGLSSRCPNDEIGMTYQ